MRNFRVVKFIETENKMVAARGSGEEGMGFCLMGAEFQFEKMKFWSWMVVVVAQEQNVVNASKLCLKIVKMVNLMLCILKIKNILRLNSNF